MPDLNPAPAVVFIPGLLCDAQLCGHMSTLEKPGEVVRALESWLEL